MCTSWWVCAWQLNLSIHKCCIISIGKPHTQYNYAVNNLTLNRVLEIKDLGMIIDHKLDFTSHCRHVLRKASMVSNMIFRNFKCRNPMFLKRMYLSLVRPQAEYGTPIWSPSLIKNIDLIEKIQRRYTKKIPGLGNLTYKQRLETLKFDSLEKRRLYNDIIEGYKIINQLTSIDAQNLITFNPSVRTTRSSTKLNIYPKRYRTKIGKNFFSMRLAKFWNSLNAQTQHSHSLKHFIRLIKKHDFGILTKF